MTWDEMRPLLEQACSETLTMVGLSSLVTAVVGLPLGVVLSLTDRGGLLPCVVVNKTLGALVNLTRSLPFIILLIALIPFTRWAVGTSIGVDAAVVPLSVGAVPFFARLVETSVREVDHGLVEAVQSMGGGVWAVVRKVLLPESLPSLVSGLTTTVIALIGYSAMAGAVAAGGLGDLAVRYGYQRFENGLMIATVLLLVVLVTGVQVVGDLLARALDHRGGRAGHGPFRIRPRMPRHPSR
ncbi:ABC transporter permease [Wenjunlia vitaminophila]|uniref:ABC transporter permease n=1 Tax=Wenjunlia vitaminophila TaxID=76728 RepID=A0A0T6LW29_WENVI|nr:methionine ABC transporter permease [Wenjunlia vitaminophila]KRV50315.1 ABC transporter permease [Wenjunlia vitaminophila]